MKSFRRKDGEDQPPSSRRNGERDFHKEKPANETHASKTDPDARIWPDGRCVTVGADKTYDTAAFVAAAREMNVTPHVTQNINDHRGSNIDKRTTRHPGYLISLTIRKRIEGSEWLDQGRGGHGAGAVPGAAAHGWSI